MSRSHHATGICALLLPVAALFMTLSPVQASRTAEREARIRVEGRVRGVSGSNRSFTLEADRANYEVRFVGPASGFGARLPDLANGDLVEVRGTVRRGVLEAESVVLRRRVDSRPEEGTVSGRVTETDPREGRFTMDSDRGGRVRVTYDGLTAIRGAGWRGNVANLRSGDRVRVEGRWDGDRNLRARRVEVTTSSSSGSGGWRSGDSGRITVVGREGRYMRVRFDGREWRVFVQNAAVRAGTRRIDVDDLRVGDRVEVYGQISGDEIRATRVEVIDYRGGQRRSS